MLKVPQRCNQQNSGSRKLYKTYDSENSCFSTSKNYERKEKETDSLKKINQLLYCTNLFESQFKHTGERVCIYDTIMEMQNTHWVLMLLKKYC